MRKESRHTKTAKQNKFKPVKQRTWPGRLVPDVMLFEKKQIK